MIRLTQAIVAVMASTVASGVAGGIAGGEPPRASRIDDQTTGHPWLMGKSQWRKNSSGPRRPRSVILLSLFVEFWTRTDSMSVLIRHRSVARILILIDDLRRLDGAAGAREG